MDDGERLGDIVGRIKQRLLVNQWVDPDEVAGHIPEDLRPHIGPNGGVVVGCCMIEIDGARPWPLPSLAGVNIRAAAHRISVEVGPPCQPTRAVWVPVRHTDSTAAVISGGRLFPGVHATAGVAIDKTSDTLTWSVTSAGRQSAAFDIEARACLDRIDHTASDVADIVIGTALGLSPGRRPNQIESVEMKPHHQQYSVVKLLELKSDFMSGFSSAVPAETLLMNDVDVTWHPSKAAAERLT